MPSFAQADKSQADVAEVSMEDVFSTGTSQVILNV